MKGIRGKYSSEAKGNKISTGWWLRIILKKFLNKFTEYLNMMFQFRLISSPYPSLTKHFEWLLDYHKGLSELTKNPYS